MASSQYQEPTPLRTDPFTTPLLYGTDLGVARFYLPPLRRPVVSVSADDIKAATGYYNLFGGQILRVTGGNGFLELDGAGLDGRFVPRRGTDLPRKVPITN